MPLLRPEPGHAKQLRAALDAALKMTVDAARKVPPDSVLTTSPRYAEEPTDEWRTFHALRAEGCP
jgi:hypothetical protein